MVSLASSHLEEVLRLIPGYDPFATAEDCWLDEEAAQRAIDFFPECLRHIEGAMAGKPFVLEPWQQAIVGNLFGWKRYDDQGRIVRRYREAFIYVPRKNGKTPLVAGIGLLVLYGDGEAGAQCYIAAAEREQAALLFRHAKGMVEREPELEQRSKIYGGIGQRSIVLKSDEASSLKVLSADADTKHGGNSHLIMVDEVHAQPNRDLIDVLLTSMASANRSQPLALFITTADYLRPSICNEKYDESCSVRDGRKKDKAFLPVIYEASSGDDWTDEKTWIKANPNYGVSVSKEYMARECEKAKQNPSYENTFKRLHLNLRTSSRSRAINSQAWDMCLCDEWPDLQDVPCFGGLDLASKRDLTAKGYMWPHENKMYVKVHFFLPRAAAEKAEKESGIPYTQWERDKWITLTDGNVTDYSFIQKEICEDHERYNIEAIGVDQWNSTHLMNELQAAGIETLCEVNQQARSLNEPSKELLAMIASQRLQHDGNPVLAWCAGNVESKEDSAENIKFEKPTDTPGAKKDGIDAIVNAVFCYINSESRGSGSIYDTPGALGLMGDWDEESESFNYSE